MHAAPRVLLSSSSLCRGILLPLALVSACFDESVPSGAVLLCTADDDCPTTMRCEPLRHACIQRSSDTTPPVVTAQFSPLFVRGGETMTLTITGSEALGAEAAALFFAPGVVPLTWAFDSTSEGAEQRFTALLSADSSEGTTRLLQVEVADAAGNVTRADVDAAFTLDRTPPRIDRVVLDDGDGDDILRLSDTPGSNTLGARVLLSERPADGGLAVSLSAVRATDCAEGLNLSFSCSLVVDSLLVLDGPNDVVVEATDAAGNRASTTINISVDTQAPTVVPGSAQVRVDHGPGVVALSPEIARAGSVVLVSATFEEPVSGVVPVRLDALGGVPFSSVEGGNGSALLSARLALGADVLAGVYPIVAEVEDAFGHRAERTLGTVEVEDFAPSPCPPPPLSTGGPGCGDADGDGQAGASASCAPAVALDCDDANPAVFVGASEIPGDRVGNNCAGPRVDAPIDETTGVFFDAQAPAPGLGTRAQPYASLDDALDAAGTGVVFLARGAVGVTSESLVRASLIGGLDPDDGWSPVSAETSSVACPSCAVATVLPQLSLLGAVVDRISFPGMEIDLAGTVLARSIVTDGELDLTEGALLVNAQAGELRAFGVASRVVGSTVGSVLVEQGTMVVVRSRAGDVLALESVVDVVSSRVGGLVCNSCGALRVAFSSVVSTNVDAIYVLESTPSLLSVVATYLESAPGAFATAFEMPTDAQSRFTAHDVRYFTPLGGTWVDGGLAFISADAAGDIEMNACSHPACDAASGNRVIEASALDGDGVHTIGSALDLIDAATATEGIPPSAAADIDGDCRFDPIHGLPDVGADER